MQHWTPESIIIRTESVPGAIADAYGKIVSGSSSLASGSKDLLDGSVTLKDGASDLYDGISSNYSNNNRDKSWLSFSMPINLMVVDQTRGDFIVWTKEKNLNHDWDLSCFLQDVPLELETCGNFHTQQAREVAAHLCCFISCFCCFWDFQSWPWSLR